MKKHQKIDNSQIKGEKNRKNQLKNKRDRMVSKKKKIAHTTNSIKITRQNRIIVHRYKKKEQKRKKKKLIKMITTTQSTKGWRHAMTDEK